MKQLYLILCSILFLSCSGETIQSDLNTVTQKAMSFETSNAMHVKALSLNKLTQVEQGFREKILRLSGNEFKHKLQTLSSEELEKFAISFLLEDSKKLLIEHNYSQKQLKELSDFKLVQQAIKLYNQKINKQL